MENKPKILIVDDERLYINLLMELLQEEQQIFIAKNGAQALTRLNEIWPDLILMDIKMPEMDGYETCRQLKADPQTQSIPIIVLTASTDQDAEIKAFENGAIDFIAKPMTPATVKAQVKTHLALRQASLDLENQNQILEQRVIERTRDIILAQDVAIHCMVFLAEARDFETGGHIKRTQHYIKSLAEHLRGHQRF